MAFPLNRDQTLPPTQDEDMLQTGSIGIRAGEAEWESRGDHEHDPDHDHPEHAAHFRSKSSTQTNASSRRRSVFRGRSRSNTAHSALTSTYIPNTATTTTTPPIIPVIPLSPATTSSSTESSFMDLSHNDRSSSSLGSSFSDRPEKSAKSLLSRGSRLLRKQTSKFNMVATVSEEDETYAKTVDFFRFQRSKTADPNEELKRTISDPFDFHHLTHTSPAQFQSLGNAPPKDLVTEFSVIRASQRPDKALKGIRADDIYVHNLPSEEWDRPFTSPSRSPKSPRPAREGRPVENFSRPVSKLLPRTPGSPSFIAPPRTSSRQAIHDLPATTAEAIEELLGLVPARDIPALIPEKDQVVPVLPTPVRFNPFAQSDVGHAITIFDGEIKLEACMSHNDHRGHDATTGTVPETTLTPDHKKEEDHRQPVGEILSGLAEGLETDLPSSATMYLQNIKAPLQVPSKGGDHSVRTIALEVPRDPRAISEPLASPTLPRTGPIRKPGCSSILDKPSVSLSPKQATSLEELPTSWEEDIDYCYEHAAESNCNFDWRRGSVDVPQIAVDAASPYPSPLANPLGDHQPTLPTLAPLFQPLQTPSSVVGTSELEPSPAQSVDTNGGAAVILSATEDKSANYFLKYHRHQQPTERHPYMSTMIPQFIPSAITKETQEDILYAALLGAADDTERHFAFDTQGDVHTMDFSHSPLSGYSPISKYDSQESIILSRAASIVRKHRSSTSTNSVPELVPSLPSSRENTIRETILYGDYPLMESPPAVPELPRPSSASRHRQTKSLANEVASGLRASRSSGCIDKMAMHSQTGLLAHDRAKSVSALQQEQPKVEPYDETLSFAARMKSRDRPSQKPYSPVPTVVSQVRSVGGMI